jgi:hypothetical protein
MRIILSFLFVMTVSLRAATYQQSFDLPPIQLNASELRTTLMTISEIVARINPRPAENQYPHYSINITDNNTGETVVFDEFVIPETHLPSPATTVHIRYSLDGAPISRIELNFSDYERTLQVEGDSYTDVTGCATLLQKELSRYSVPFGGPILRIILLEIPIMAFAILGIVFSKLQSRYSYFFLALIPVMFVIALIVPWKYILAGFVFHESEPSWIVRYSPQFTFVALLLTILIPALQLILRKKPHQKRQKKQHETPIKAGEA